MAAKSLEDVLREQAPVLAGQIQKAAEWSDSEMDLQIEIEKALDIFKRAARIELKGRHNKTVGSGRPDSIYSNLVVEYKKPGYLRDSNDAAGNREVLKQLRNDLREMEAEEKRKIEKLFGVGTDGRFIIFVRYRNGKWEEQKPLPITPQTAERFLRALLALAAKGKAFQPEYLAGDFGAESKLAREGIETLYRALRKTENPRVKVLFEEWEILFGEIGGYDVKGFNKKVENLADHYGIKGSLNPPALLFCVQTYYALFMKLLAAEIINFFNPLFPSQLAKFHQAGTTEKIVRELKRLEDGGIYRDLRIHNFLEGDLFSWYLDAWDTRDSHGKPIDIERVVRDMVACLDEYDPVTLSVEPTESRDLLKSLYQELFPKDVRHDLGEYYTPDWLAEQVVQQIQFNGDPQTRVLDPACGSGTFLVTVLERMRAYSEEHMIPAADLLRSILTNVVGFDLNPLAVMAARLNYLIAIRDLVKYGDRMEIPVYLCDSIMTPEEYGDLFEKGRRLPTSAAKFIVPSEVTGDQKTLGRYAEILEKCVLDRVSVEQFLSDIRSESLPCEDEKTHRKLFGQLATLEKNDQNHIWARIIKNAFAPLFIRPVDLIVGNPPWVNWENLPPAYRADTKQLWIRQGLFPSSVKGFDRILGKTKSDISMLMTYVAAERYLKPGGKLGFVITQSVFKTSGAGQGFRRFKLGDQTPLEVLKVDDMTEIKPFPGVGNRTAILYLQKGKETVYPVDFVSWEKIGSAGLEATESLEEVLGKTARHKRAASPVASGDATSAWTTSAKGVGAALRKVAGHSDYKAHAGAYTGGANGVYWVEILQRLSGGLVRVRNITEGAKRKVEQREDSILNDELLYPLLRGRDVQRWSATPSAHILMTHLPGMRLRAIPESVMREKHRRTWDYLKYFEKELRQRAALKRYFSRKTKKGHVEETGPFYSMFNIGVYTFAPYKVVWKEVATTLNASLVVSKKKAHPVICDHTLIQIAFEDEAEANYVCAVLNSSPFKLAVGSYIVLHPDPHILQEVHLPRFSAKNTTHLKLAERSARAHAAAAKGDSKTVAEIELEIDSLAASLWGLTNAELKDIQKASG